METFCTTFRSCLVTSIMCRVTQTIVYGGTYRPFRQQNKNNAWTFYLVPKLLLLHEDNIWNVQTEALWEELIKRSRSVPQSPFPVPAPNSISDYTVSVSDLMCKVTAWNQYSSMSMLYYIDISGEEVSEQWAQCRGQHLWLIAWPLSKQVYHAFTECELNAMQRHMGHRTK